MTQARERWSRLIDPALAVVIGLSYLALLLLTVSDLGYARDEGFYYQAAQRYAQWFELLLREPALAITREHVDPYWSVNHEHPALMKSLFALSLHYLHDKWHWFSEAGTALRFPGMAVSSLALSVIFLWGRATLGRAAGIVAALLFGLMPRVFYHSHLDCFDVPVASMWLVTTYAYWRSTVRGGVGWSLATGVLYGLLLDTKHNSWLLPIALTVHWALTWRGGVISELRRWRLPVPTALLAMLTLGPLVFYVGWPWIWYDTVPRLREYVAFHMGHEYYNMEFLGQTYWKPPMPLGYAWVMTLATVPGITLLLFAIGLSHAARDVTRRWKWSAVRAWALRLRDAVGRSSSVGAATGRGEPEAPEGSPLRPVRASDSDAGEHGSPGDEPGEHESSRKDGRAGEGEDESAPEGKDEGAPNSDRGNAPERAARDTRCGSDATRFRPHATEWLWLLCLLVCYAPWLSSNTPIFGGTKHWLTAYPFLCLFAGRGFALVARLLRARVSPRLPDRLQRWPISTALLFASVVTGPAVMTFDAHPFALSAYTPLVGGASGAATLGLNRTFWGYTTGSVQGYLNRHVPRGGKIYVHDTALQSFALMRRDGRIRSDLHGVLWISQSDYALYHHEPHMSRVEYQLWVDYGTTAPAHMGVFHGVPVVWVYARPESP